jgi:hypothetical protein
MLTDSYIKWLGCNNLDHNRRELKDDSKNDSTRKTQGGPHG